MITVREGWVFGGVIVGFTCVLWISYCLYLLRRPPGARARLWKWFDIVMEVERLR
jgi:hypothetical protein